MKAGKILCNVAGVLNTAGAGWFLLMLLACLLAQSVGAQDILSLDQSGRLSIDLVQVSFAQQVFHILMLITVMSVAPGFLIVLTSFTRFIIVFSLLKSALGLQQAPPNFVLVSLALFLTAAVMYPVFEDVYAHGIQPVLEQKISYEQGYERGIKPLKKFLMSNVQQEDLEFFLEINNEQKTIDMAKIEDIPMRALVPAFVISELSKAFKIGFLLYIPFLVIDMLIASVLMSMGMMMLPPATISLPFKVIFFVLVDGWGLLSEGLVKGVNV